MDRSVVIVRHTPDGTAGTLEPALTAAGMGGAH